MKGWILSVMCLESMVSMVGAGTSCDVPEKGTGGWKQQEFITTMWCQPPAKDKYLDQLVREGYNLYPTRSRDLPDPPPLKLLDLARKHGLKVLLGNPLIDLASLDDPVKKAKLGELIDSVKKHPALEGYNLFDEPDATTFPKWAKLVEFLREHDPDHMIYFNLLPSYANQKQLGVFPDSLPKDPGDMPNNPAGRGIHKDTVVFYNEYLRQFIQQVKPDLISYDHYHFCPEKDGDQYFLNLELIRNASMQAGVPFLNIIQASNIEWRRMPNKNELRWLAYTTMAYGGRGISWFLYWGPVRFGGMYQNGKRMPHTDYVAEINQDIKALGPELMKLNSTQVYHSEPLPIGTQSMVGSPVTAVGGQYVIGMFKEKNTTNAFMIMNRDCKTASTAKLTLNMGKGTLMEFNINKRAWVEVKPVANGSVISVDLIPGGGRLFKIVNEP